MDIIEKYRYDAYGNIVTGITAPYNTTGYTSHTYDDKSGLIDMNARWYNPSNGRFMQEDTYKGTLTQPLTQNRYSYVMNNPINLWDPTGYAAEEGTGGGVGGGTPEWIPASYHIEEWENLDYRIVSEWFIDYSNYYVEFDVNSSLLVTKNEELGWSLVKSKNDMYLKLAEKKGQSLPAPIGENITHVTTK